MRKAFLQILLRETDRDAQRILWYDSLDTQNVLEYRFTRAIFGATSSPYILGATIEAHLEKFKKTYPQTVRALAEDTYVDDIQGGRDLEDVIRKKLQRS